MHSLSNCYGQPSCIIHVDLLQFSIDRRVTLSTFLEIYWNLWQHQIYKAISYITFVLCYLTPARYQCLHFTVEYRGVLKDWMINTITDKAQWEIQLFWSVSVFIIIITEHDNIRYLKIYIGLPGWLSSKQSTCNSGDAGNEGSIPRSGRSPGGENSNPLQYSCLENSMDRGA